jgi:hypothetical protein
VTMSRALRILGRYGVSREVADDQRSCENTDGWCKDLEPTGITGTSKSHHGYHAARAEQVVFHLWVNVQWSTSLFDV